jgi:hypothetical protein
MTACDNQTMSSRALDIVAPVIFNRVIQPAFLMPGESLNDYEAIRDMIIQEITPQSGIEWLWAADLIELSCDIVRYRALRQKMLEIRRRDAIDAMLQRLDLPGISHPFRQSARDQTRLNAEQWRTDPIANTEIENRLTAQGIDEGSVNAEVLIQSRELFILFDSLMQSAQARRIMLLREINRRRISLEIEQGDLPKRRIAGTDTISFCNSPN